MLSTFGLKRIEIGEERISKLYKMSEELIQNATQQKTKKMKTLKRHGQ